MKRILIIGAGGMGVRHIRAFLEIGDVEVTCWDPDGERLRRVISEHPPLERPDSLEAAADGGLDGVVIASPTHTHREYMEWCIGKSVDFLVEKPIHNEGSGIETIIQRADAAGLVAGVAFPRRHSRPMREMKQRLEAGLIGDLKAIRTEFSQDFRKYRPDYRQTYYARLATGGGILLDALSHHVDLACSFAGRVRTVVSLNDRVVFEGVEGEDLACLLLRFENGILGSVTGNQFQKPNTDFIELVGTEGNLRYERLSGVLSWNLSDAVEWNSEHIDEDWDEVVRRQAAGFLEALTRKGPGVMTSLREGLQGLRVVQAARRSQHERIFVEIA